jgi:pimeloyl-ACP methyl ester carboxylesterase
MLMPRAHLKTGITMYYEELGSGEPLVLIAGTGADHATWVLQVPEFSKSFRVITLDNRGSGQSECPDAAENYSVSLMADDVAALLDFLAIDRAHIAGQSLGSAISQEFAINHPDRVKTLQLHVTWGKSDDRIRQIANSMRIILEKGTLRDYFLFIYSLAFSPALMEKQPGFLETFYQESVVKNDFPPTLKGLMGQWNAVFHHDAEARLAKIAAPTLICAAEGDILVHQDYARRVASKIRSSIFHLFRGPCSSHLVNIEMAPLFNRLVREFLETCRGAG